MCQYLIWRALICLLRHEVEIYTSFPNVLLEIFTVPTADFAEITFWRIHVMWFEINKITPVLHFKDETVNFKQILSKMHSHCKYFINHSPILSWLNGNLLAPVFLNIFVSEPYKWQRQMMLVKYTHWYFLLSFATWGNLKIHTSPSNVTAVLFCFSLRASTHIRLVSLWCSAEAVCIPGC